MGELLPGHVKQAQSAATGLSEGGVSELFKVGAGLSAHGSGGLEEGLPTRSNVRHGYAFKRHVLSSPGSFKEPGFVMKRFFNSFMPR